MEVLRYLVPVVVLVVVAAALWRWRHGTRVRERLFGPGAEPAPGAGTPSTDPRDRDPSGLAGWLGTAGYDHPGARAAFVMWSIAALLAAAFLGLIVQSSGFTERAIVWIEGIPGGVADVFVPIMAAATWLVAAIVALLPVVWVRRQRRLRAREVERDLPTALGLLATLAESGLGFDAAAQRVERALGPDRVLAQEIERVRQATLAGSPRARAFRDMAQRLDVPSLTTFSSALIHAEHQGASIGETLRLQATDLWARRREQAIQRAQTLPTRLAFPLVLCFLPGVFVWTFGPAVSEFLRLTAPVIAGQP